MLSSRSASLLYKYDRFFVQIVSFILIVEGESCAKGRRNHLIKKYKIPRKPGREESKWNYNYKVKFKLVV